jgi:hypothetical protein
LVDAAPVFHVDRGLAQKSRIVVKISKARVASDAKQAAQLAGFVTVIDGKCPLGLSFAECTSAVLPRQNVVVVLQRHPVCLLEMHFATISGALGKRLCPEFWICCISLPTPRIELRPMGFSIGAAACILPFAPFQIFEMVHVLSSANS